jgi:hypothetical protein
LAETLSDLAFILYIFVSMPQFFSVSDFLENWKDEKKVVGKEYSPSRCLQPG